MTSTGNEFIDSFGDQFKSLADRIGILEKITDGELIVMPDGTTYNMGDLGLSDVSVRVFMQDDAPTGLNSSTHVGDIWIDTNDNNKAYWWDGIGWIVKNASDNYTGGVGLEALGPGVIAKLLTSIDITQSSSAPSSPTYSDLWKDTGSGNALKRWNGSSWAIVSDSNIVNAVNAALSDVGADISDGGIRVFYTSAAPGGMNSTTHKGDLWYDTDDKYHKYFWGGSSWVDVTGRSEAGTTDGIPPTASPTPQVNGGIGSLFVQWDELNNADPLWYYVFISETSPVVAGAATNLGRVDGSLAVVQTLPDGSRLQPNTTYYVALMAADADGVGPLSTEASAQVELIDLDDFAAGVRTDIENIDTIQTTADSKNTNYYQASQPTGGTYKEGDLWFDSDDNYKAYVWTGSAWQLAQDAATANANASAALTAANGKNKIYYQTSMPTGGTYNDGDVWFDTDDGYHMYVRKSGVWTDSQLGSNAIADAAITNAKIANLDAGKITTGTLSANRIGANTITATKLAIGDFTNLWPNQYFAGGITSDVKLSNVTATGNTPPDAGTSMRLNSRDHIGTKTFEVRPGEKIQISYYQKPVAGSEFAQPGLYFTSNGTGYADSGVVIADPTVYYVGDHPLDPTWSQYTVTITVPNTINAGAKVPTEATLYFFINQASSGGATSKDIWNVTVRRMTTGSLIVDGTIIGSKLSAGAVTADKISANSIAADALIIGSMTFGLVQNGSFEADTNNDGKPDGWTLSEGSGTNWDRYSGVAAQEGQYVLRDQGGGNKGFCSKAFPVVPGRTYGVKMQVAAAAAGATGSGVLRMNWASASVSTGYVSAVLRNGYTDIWTWTPSTSWTPFTGVWTAPSFAKYASFTFVNNTSGGIYIDDVRVGEQASSVMIGNGQIVADKIGVGAVIAEKILGNTITGDKIFGNTITGDKLSATAIDGKTITGALIRTTSQSQRGIRIDGFNNVMEVFDAGGTRTFYVNGSTGDVDIEGNFSTGSTGARAELYDAAAGYGGMAGLQLWGYGYENVPGQVYASAGGVGSWPFTAIFSPRFYNYNWNSFISLYETDTGYPQVTIGCQNFVSGNTINLTNFDVFDFGATTTRIKGMSCKMQSGTDTCTITSGNGSKSVTFAQTFPSAGPVPHITCTAIAATVDVLFGLSTVSRSGFTVNVKRTGGSSTDISFHWIAISTE